MIPIHRCVPVCMILCEHHGVKLECSSSVRRRRLVYAMASGGLAITFLVHSRIYHVNLGLRICMAKLSIVALAHELVSSQAVMVKANEVRSLLLRMFHSPSAQISPADDSMAVHLALVRGYSFSKDCLLFFVD